MTASDLISNKKLRIENLLKCFEERIINLKENGYLTKLDEYCEAIKQDIEISTESELCNLESMRTKMLNSVEEYALLCRQNSEKIDINLVTKFISEKKSDIEYFKKSEDANKFDEIQKIIYSKIRELEEELFSDFKINYMDNNLIMDSSNIGTVSFSDTHFNLANYQLKNPRIFRFPNHKRKAMANVNICDLNEVEFAFCYHYTGSNTKNTFNVDLLNVKEKKMQHFQVKDVENIAITIIDRRLIVAFRMEINKFFLAYYTMSFEPKHEIMVDHPIKCLHSHDNKIYATSSLPLIFHVYSKRLEKMYEFGQNYNPFGLTFIPLSRIKTSKYSFKENYVFIYNEMIVNIFNEKTLENERTIKIESSEESFDYFSVVSLTTFLFANYKTKCVYLHDLNGKCIEKYCFFRPNLMSSIHLTKNNSLLFVNPNLMRVYIYSA